MLSVRRIVETWWPLATSWLLMGMELPILSAIVARLPDPKIHLAAYGGVVFPLALIIEAPIIQLLAASTALSKDGNSYNILRRYTLLTGIGLTGLHLLVAFSPLYYLVVEKVIGAPAEIIEPARLGLKIMLPWTLAIAYRRFNQGVLIRFGHSRAVGGGTVIRLCMDGLVLFTGYMSGGRIPGIVVATSAVIAGVISEAIYAGLRVRPVLRQAILRAPLSKVQLSWRAFFDFYIPLALTSFLFLLAQPMGSAAISRMPRALESLAVWPVVSGLVFMLRSLGIAYNEVVVALLDEPNSSPNLRRVTYYLSGLTSLILLIIAATPLSRLWFGTISGLKPDLAQLAEKGLWLALPLPGLSVLQSWFQGTILHGRNTRGITEAIVIYLVTAGLTLYLGVVWRQVTGLYIGLGSLVLGTLLQSAWLGYRSLPIRRRVLAGDQLLQ